MKTKFNANIIFGMFPKWSLAKYNVAQLVFDYGIATTQVGWQPFVASKISHLMYKN